MHLLEMVGSRKRTATEPPFTGQITDLDGNPSDLTGITSMDFRVGTPGSTPIIDATVIFLDQSIGTWKYEPSDAEAAALTVGVVLVHLVITRPGSPPTLEPVPYDHYFQLEILEML